MKTTIAAVSGGFDPLHVGHVDLFRAASEYGRVLVLVNSDDFLLKKKGYVFMPIEERLELIRSIRYVDAAMPVIDTDMTVRKTLEHYLPDFFINGGDRHNAHTIPEATTCQAFGIEMVFTGQPKRQSSSQLCSQLSRQA